MKGNIWPENEGHCSDTVSIGQAESVVGDKKAK